MNATLVKIISKAFKDFKQDENLDHELFLETTSLK